MKLDKKRFFVGILGFFMILGFVWAEEGMWLLNQLPGLKLAEKGFNIDVAKIYNPSAPSITDAIVLLGGGTAELVSEQGLLLTNHHVAFGAVQRVSTSGTDFISKGFLAETLRDEIEAPGYSASILMKMEDVTKAVLEGAGKIKDLVKRQKTIDQKIQKMTDGIEKGKSDISANIASMYEGKQYILFVFKRYDDVRVVYVPPAAIGNYGGEIDNWMWPRHTGDFSFMRIYMAPDGSGRKYHQDNVPLKPRYWLKVAGEGLKEGDQTFIMGYPGFTSRYRTSFAVDYSYRHQYPETIALYSDTINLLQSFEKDGLKAKMKVAGLIKGLSNGMKKSQGNVDGMGRTGFVEQKKAFERELMGFLQKDPALIKKYGHILGEIEQLYQKVIVTKAYEDALAGMGGRLCGTLMSIASQAYGVAAERAKPKSERDPRFSEKDIERTVSRLQYGYMSYYEPADKALLQAALRRAQDLPEDMRIKALESLLGGEGIDAFLDKAYELSKLKDVEFARTLFGKSVQELKNQNDPFINLAAELYPEKEAQRKKDEAFAASISQLRKQYIDALYTWKGADMYPDANRTIRFSFGPVKGYAPRDAVVYKPFTTIKGAIEKRTAQEPFDLPQSVVDLWQARDFGRWACPTLQDVPIAFTHMVDSTGGNSGSPVLNANGELVGILFDGNYEAMTGDWQYDAEIQRSISVDIRYVMFITEKLGKATRILKEMKL